ncbi:hypothetical protein ACGFXB_44325 [Streptomyces canus]|uniref:hypothetical protein n=1 Tax=Streptomyces canus TaxID=58343 RepID=UPI003715A7F6
MECQTWIGSAFSSGWAAATYWSGLRERQLDALSTAGISESQTYVDKKSGATAERAAHARSVDEAAGRHIGRLVAHPADKIEYARLLKGQASSFGKISTKTGIPKTCLHRYLQE